MCLMDTILIIMLYVDLRWHLNVKSILKLPTVFDSFLLYYIFRQISCKTVKLYFGVHLKWTGEAIVIPQRGIYPKKLHTD